MMMREHVPIASLSTLRVGGLARYVFDIESAEQVTMAFTFAREHQLPWRVLGEGSNILADDAGFPGVLLHMILRGIQKEESGETVLVSARAGENWDSLVRYAAENELWGIENLAGIPGTVGASPVQNIGAYGMEVKDTIHSVTVYDAHLGEVQDFSNAECRFGYRESRFKQEPYQIILGVTFKLQRNGTPRTMYADLERAVEQGVTLDTPAQIGAAVREIRSRKFPDLTRYGTAGSFFKNPVISEDAYRELKGLYPELAGYPAREGVKVPLAFILDKVLGLRGYRVDNVALFEMQPLVLVAYDGATAIEIDAFAKEIAEKVFDVTGIKIEREVRTFP